MSFCLPVIHGGGPKDELRRGAVELDGVLIGGTLLLLQQYQNATDHDTVAVLGGRGLG